jgi:membrane protein implicated in regulation of membrane protease activity
MESKGDTTVTVMILAALFLLVPIVSAFAYIDPGTGSMIVQVVIAALVGGAAFIGAFWRKLFRRRRNQDDEPADTDSE